MIVCIKALGIAVGLFFIAGSAFSFDCHVASQSSLSCHLTNDPQKPGEKACFLFDSQANLTLGFCIPGKQDSYAPGSKSSVEAGPFLLERLEKNKPSSTINAYYAFLKSLNVDHQNSIKLWPDPGKNKQVSFADLQEFVKLNALPVSRKFNVITTGQTGYFSGSLGKSLSDPHIVTATYVDGDGNKLTFEFKPKFLREKLGSPSSSTRQAFKDYLKDIKYIESDDEFESFAKRMLDLGRTITFKDLEEISEVIGVERLAKNAAALNQLSRSQGCTSKQSTPSVTQQKIDDAIRVLDSSNTLVYVPSGQDPNITQEKFAHVVVRDFVKTHIHPSEVAEFWDAFSGNGSDEGLMNQLTKNFHQLNNFYSSWNTDREVRINRVTKQPENVTLKVHTLDVMKSFRHQLDLYQVALPPKSKDLRLSETLKIALALHDIGKLNGGNRFSEQHEVTLPILMHTMNQLGYSPKEIELASYILEDPLGSFVTSKKYFSKQQLANEKVLIAQDIKDKAHKLGMDASQLARVLTSFWVSDANFYAGLNHHFQGVDGNDRIPVTQTLYSVGKNKIIPKDQDVTDVLNELDPDILAFSFTREPIQLLTFMEMLFPYYREYLAA